MTNEQIKVIALDCGFTERNQAMNWTGEATPEMMDLNHYVYEFAWKMHRAGAEAGIKAASDALSSFLMYDTAEAISAIDPGSV